MYVIGPRSGLHEDAPLREIIASRIAYDLELHASQNELEVATVSRERMRLARDLHDGILQSLTAVRLQLRLGANELDEPAKGRYQAIANVLDMEQRRLRDFVQATGSLPAARASGTTAGEALEAIAGQLAKQWDIEIAADACPPDALLTARLRYQADKIFAEAVSNSVRHGNAKHVKLKIGLTEHSVRLTASNNGKPFPNAVGRYAMGELKRLRVGPISLINRVSEAGGTLALKSGKRGTSLVIELPNR